MPKVVDALPKREAPEGFGGGGRAEQYPYTEWLDGQVWQLVGGEDFKSSPQSMQANLHGAAKRRGLKILTRIREGDVFVQARTNGNGSAPAGAGLETGVETAAPAAGQTEAPAAPPVTEPVAAQTDDWA